MKGWATAMEKDLARAMEKGWVKDLGLGMAKAKTRDLRRELRLG